MNAVHVPGWIGEAILKEVDAWPVRHSHVSVESAIDDYRLLLYRNRELEVGSVIVHVPLHSSVSRRLPLNNIPSTSPSYSTVIYYEFCVNNAVHNIVQD